jgi:hypothetical protein
MPESWWIGEYDTSTAVVFDNPTALVSYYSGGVLLRFCVIIIYCALN